MHRVASIFSWCVIAVSGCGHDTDHSPVMPPNTISSNQATSSPYEIAITDVEQRIIEAVLRHITTNPKYEYEPPLMVDFDTVPAKRFVLDPPRNDHSPIQGRGLGDLTEMQLALVSSLRHTNSKSSKLPTLHTALPVKIATQAECSSSCRESPDAMWVSLSRPAVAASGDKAVILVNYWTIPRGSLVFLSKDGDGWQITEEYHVWHG